MRISKGFTSLAPFVVILLTSAFLISNVYSKYSQQVCYDTCSTCFSQSQYACTSCQKDTQNNSLYIFSCAHFNYSNPLIIGLVVVLVVVYIVLLVFGLSMYNQLYEIFQVATLIYWPNFNIQHNSGDPTVILQGVNLGAESGNSFPHTFGSQFIAIMCIMFLFWLALILKKFIPHKRTVKLLWKLRILFPTRILGFCYNILLFSSVLQLNTINTSSDFSDFSIALSVLAVIKAAIIYLGTIYTCAFMKYDPFDKHYGVITEHLLDKTYKLTKLKICISMTNNTVILLSCILLFSSPQISLPIIIGSQTIYTSYVIGFLKYGNKRHRIFNIFGNLFMIAIFVCQYLSVGVSVSPQATAIAYYVLIILFAFFLIGLFTAEFAIQFKKVYKFVKKIDFMRFIKDQEDLSQIETTGRRSRLNTTNKTKNNIYEIQSNISKELGGISCQNSTARNKIQK